MTDPRESSQHRVLELLADRAVFALSAEEQAELDTLLLTHPVTDPDAFDRLGADILRSTLPTVLEPLPVLWRALKDGGGTMGSAFSSPVLAKIAGTDQVVVQTRTKLAGVDRETGKELWAKDIPSFRGMNILTPIPVGGDSVFTSTYGGNTHLLRVTSEGGKYDTSDTWTMRYEGNMSTPVVVGGHAYVLGKDKRLLCVNLKTGKEAWSTDERFGDYWSLVANKDRILALDNRGVLYLLKASANQFDLIEKRKVAESETWAHLAVCGDEIFIRDLSGLTAWRWTGE